MFLYGTTPLFCLHVGLYLLLFSFLLRLRETFRHQSARGLRVKMHRARPLVNPPLADETLTCAEQMDLVTAEDW